LVVRLRRGGEIKGGKLVMIATDSKPMRIAAVAGAARSRQRYKKEGR
jgi:hypothetical protein